MQDLSSPTRDQIQACCSGSASLNQWTAREVFLLGSLFFFFLIYLFILAAPDLSCSMWDLVPQPGIKPGPPALGAWSLTHWTTREVPLLGSLNPGLKDSKAGTSDVFLRLTELLSERGIIVWLLAPS